MYAFNIETIRLSKNSTHMNYFYVPKMGYKFYFVNDNEGTSTHGYEFHRFYEMNNYKAYRMHKADVERKIAILNCIIEG